MASLAGRLVLVVEDDVLLGMDVEQILEHAGCSVLGPCRSVAAALSTLRDRRPDVAILDINLNGEQVGVVADQLAEEHVPFVVLSGHSPGMLPPRHRGRPYLSKPFDAEELLRLVQRALAEASDPAQDPPPAPQFPRRR